MLNSEYGIKYSIVNLVKNELSKSELVNEKAILAEVNRLFPNERVSAVDISDLIYHLPYTQTKKG